MTPGFESEFARDVHEGLTGFGQRSLPCRYFYDPIGSALFEAITRLDEYGLTRADARILTRHAAEVVECMEGCRAVAELGSGSGSKTRPVLECMGPPQNVRYYPIDVSCAALQQCVHELETVAAVFPIEDGYLEGMREVAERREPGEKLLLLFLGSTIGNFEPAAAVNFLTSVRKLLAPGDGLLLGTDLVKPVERLLSAYDDQLGVTAAFNLNLLARINRELGGDFNLRHFHHEARYRPEAQRIEMHLRSRDRQTVSIPKAYVTVEFATGETILTEVCHKFCADQIRSLAQAAGFQFERQWVDQEWGFAESLLRV